MEGANEIKILREVVGKEGDKCFYREYRSDNKVIECRLSLSLRSAIVQYANDNLVRQESSDENLTYLTEGKEVVDPVQEAFNTGACVYITKE